MELPVWNTILSFASALLLFWVKISHDEVKRLSILLSKTREENGEKFVSKQDMHNDMNRVIQRLDRLDAKIDEFMKEQRSALG
jgi:DNA-directed RNA polymerase sigma subunit (sigma70/sigma32)